MSKNKQYYVCFNHNKLDREKIHSKLLDLDTLVLSDFVFIIDYHDDLVSYSTKISHQSNMVNVDLGELIFNFIMDIEYVNSDMTDEEIYDISKADIEKCFNSDNNECIIKKNNNLYIKYKIIKNYL